ncbi:unnamed protein product [Penicillium nalgiovense]|nr:unnamed protein product [Penicillium nalgiovense]
MIGSNIKWVEGQVKMWAKSNHVIKTSRQSRRRLEFFLFSPPSSPRSLTSVIRFPFLI